jgi:uncharacterized protein (TIGR01244 family)
MKQIGSAVILTSLALAVYASGQPADRPKAWAQRIEVEGVPNLHQVSQELYRSAQPTAQGMENLKKLGVRTVVNLRTFHSDREEIGASGLNYIHIPMQAWYPERRDAIRFLRIVADTALTPVLVHCQHGADRTGAMVAVYRTAVQGWTKREALREMTQGGFGYHRIWKNLPRWFQRLNVEKLRVEAGIRPKGQAGETP